MKEIKENVRILPLKNSPPFLEIIVCFIISASFSINSSSNILDYYLPKFFLFLRIYIT